MEVAQTDANLSEASIAPLVKYQTLARIPALDGLRGVAIILVMFFHIWEMLLSKNPSFPFSRLFMMGWMGVDIFFVISGFLITSILLDTRRCSGYFSDFYIRRALRIFPAYYGLIIIVTVAVIIFPAHDTPDFLFLRQHLLWIWVFLQNFVTAMTQRPYGYGLNHLWSLAIEAQFYLFWPLAVFLLPSTRLRVLSIFLLIGSFLIRCAVWKAGGSWFTIYFATFCRSDSLAMGSLIAIVLSRGISPKHLQFCVACGMALGVSALIYLAPRQSVQPIESDLVFAISAAALVGGSAVSMVAAGFWRGIWSGVLEMRALRYVGRISYGLYVYHFPILHIFDRIGFRLGLDPIYQSTVGAVVLSAVYVCICFTIAALSWHLIEKRALALKKRIVPRGPLSGRALAAPRQA